MRIKHKFSTLICSLAILGTACGVATANDSVTLPVTHAEEIYKTVKVSVPYQECFPVELQKQIEVPCPKQNKNVDKNTIGIDTLVGGLIGAGIGGATIDKGKSSDTGKIIGGLLGGIAANHMRGGTTKGKCYEIRKIQSEKCETRYKYETKEIPDGWKLCVTVNEKKLCTHSSYKKNFLILRIE